MVKEYDHLLNKDVKLLADSGGSSRSVYNGTIIFIGDTFLTIFDFKTQSEITVPIEKIIRIEHSHGDKNSKEDQTQ